MTTLSKCPHELKDIGFTHSPPDGYRYEAIPHKSNTIAIWIVSTRRWIYNGGDESRCIWGFYNTKKRTFHAPINSKRIGDEVDFNLTTPYSAMQLNLTPLEACFK